MTGTMERAGFYRYGPRKQTSTRRIALWRVLGPLCAYCAEEMREGKYPLQATIDHVIPLCRGGKDNRSNVILACRDCNELKGELTVEEFEAAVIWAVEHNIILPPRRPSGHIVSFQSMREMDDFFIRWRIARRLTAPTSTLPDAGSDRS